MLDYVPIAFITAKDGRNVTALLNLARNLHKQAGVRVNTGDLNRVVREALNANPPPMRQNRRPKVFYATQAGTLPPTIVLFTNGPELFDQTYQRYLIGYLRDRFPFREVPLNLVLRARKHTAAPSGERDTIERPAPPAEPPRRKKKTPDQKKAPDLAGLEFVSEGDDAEVERDLKHYESELWNI